MPEYYKEFHGRVVSDNDKGSHIYMWESVPYRAMNKGEKRHWVIARYVREGKPITWVVHRNVGNRIVKWYLEFVDLNNCMLSTHWWPLRTLPKYVKEKLAEVANQNYMIDRFTGEKWNFIDMEQIGDSPSA
jgi:hypothetical protein